MAWDGVEFRDRNGNLVVGKTRETLLRLVEKALGTPDADPSLLLNTASEVCANIDKIQNLPAYASRSIFRVARRGYVAERKIQARMQPLSGLGRHLEATIVSIDPIERQILLEEILETLGSIDKEIYTRRIKGQSFPDIDKALSLNPRTSEYRFREAKLRIRKVLSDRPPR